MLIFIDESGSFVIPPHGGISISCVGAAVVPEATASLLWMDLDRMRKQKGFPGGELKGSSLNEAQVAGVIEVAARHGVRFFVAATEMSQYDPADILAHRDGQADRLVASLTPRHMPSLVTQLQGLRATMRKMSLQLFVQFALLLELVSRLLRTITVHFSLHRPRELGAFHWKLDGKSSTRTESERLWQLLGGGLLQSEFLREPVAAIREGDYADFDAEFLHATQELPDHLPSKGRGNRVNGDVVDLQKILNDSMVFADSRSSTGLQLADVLANTYRRALMGNLQFSGWKSLPLLMRRGASPATGMLYIALNGGNRLAPRELSQVLTYIESEARFMLDA